MNLKDKLNIFKKELVGNNKLTTDHKRIIKDFFESGSIRLTKEQYDFLKRIYLIDGYVVGMHKTSAFNVKHIFEVGLYNYNYIEKKSNSLSNTVMSTSLLFPLLSYHQPSYATVILMFPNEILEGKRGLFEKLNDGRWGIPSQYIVGALMDGKVVQNKNHYNPYYCNPRASFVDDISSLTIRTKPQKLAEIDYCDKFFNEQLEKGRGFGR